MSSGHHDGNPKWRSLTEKDVPLEAAAQALLAEVRLPPEEAAACLPPAASTEAIARLQTIEGFSDHARRMLHALEAHPIVMEEAARDEIDLHQTKAIRHIARIKAGLEHLAEKYEIRKVEEAAIKTDVSHGNVPGLYDNVSDFLLDLARWVEGYTRRLEHTPPETFEQRQKQLHPREESVERAIHEKRYPHYNEALYEFHDLHPERIRATAAALHFFQQAYDRIMGGALQSAGGPPAAGSP